VQPLARQKASVGRGVLPPQVEGVKGPWCLDREGAVPLAVQSDIELFNEGRSTAIVDLLPGDGVEIMEVRRGQPADPSEYEAPLIAGAYLLKPGWAPLVRALQWKSVAEWVSDHDASQGRSPGSLGKLRVCVRSSVDPLEDTTDLRFGRLVLVRSPSGEWFTNASASGAIGSALGTMPRDVTEIDATRRSERRIREGDDARRLSNR
jgi:hypothetical protein